MNRIKGQTSLIPQRKAFILRKSRSTSQLNFSTCCRVFHCDWIFIRHQSLGWSHQLKAAFIRLRTTCSFWGFPKQWCDSAVKWISISKGDSVRYISKKRKFIQHTHSVVHPWSLEPSQGENLNKRLTQHALHLSYIPVLIISGLRYVSVCIYISTKCTRM